MPDRLINLLIRIMYQENGYLLNRARRKEFNSLTVEEIAKLEL